VDGEDTGELVDGEEDTLVVGEEDMFGDVTMDIEEDIIGHIEEPAIGEEAIGEEDIGEEEAVWKEATESLKKPVELLAELEEYYTTYYITIKEFQNTSRLESLLIYKDKLEKLWNKSKNNLREIIED